MAEIAKPTPWSSPLVKRGTVAIGVSETTPFAFKGRLYRAENVHKSAEFPGMPAQHRFHEDAIRIRDVETGELISVPLVNHYFGEVFVWEGRAYLFAGDYGHDKPWWNITEIVLTTSDDLIRWSEPQVVIRAENGEHIFNTAICRGEEGFVLLYESNEPTWPAFTFKYCISTDLVNWVRVPDAIYARDKYVGGPALYYEGGRYYTLYLHDLGGKWETRVSRSTDLLHWEEAPLDRPFLTYDSSRITDPVNYPGVHEINASDAELCLWEGRTIVYFNGGDQTGIIDLQKADFEGSPRELLEAFFAEPEGLSLPSPRQLRYQENQLGAFIHFGMATYFEPEMLQTISPAIDATRFSRQAWGMFLSTPGPAAFDPEELDAEQWVCAAKAMGARHVVLTAKHHSGFCLWPTESTEYSVKGSPWRGGKGDLLREFVDACRKHGVSPGFYISAADAHQVCLSTPDPMGERKLCGDLASYCEVLTQQFREILTGYGELAVVWLDGALDPLGWDVEAPDGKANGFVPWDALVAMVRELQPSAVVMGGTRPDIRWTGNEEGLASYPLWNVLKEGEWRSNYLPPVTQGWLVPEADIFTRENWFWTPGSDGTLASDERMLRVYLESIGVGANLLVNLTPDRRGLIPDAEVAMLARLGATIERRFGTPLGCIGPSGAGDAPWGEGQTLELQLEGAMMVDGIVVEEDLAFGQRIRAYRVDALVGGGWSTVAEGQSIGRRRAQAFAPVLASRLRLKVIATDPMPKVRSFAAFATGQAQA